MRFSPMLLACGVVAGLSSGLFGIGGGVVMVPLLAIVASFEQHRAHATSLAAGVFLAAAGAAIFGRAGDVDLSTGFLLAAGALLGAPVGARLMHRIPAQPLKIAFGVLLVTVAVVMVLG